MRVEDNRRRSTASSGRRVALASISADVLRGEGFRTFNNGARRIQAALAADPALADAEVHVLDFDSPSPEEVVAAIEAINPDIFAASCYVWSFSTFCAAARELQRRNPELTIVFGGPSARPAMMELEPFHDAAHAISALCVGEGEQPFRAVVAAADRSRATLRAIPGLAVQEAGRWNTSLELPPQALDELASPYQLGLAPRGVTAHLEASRGCSMHCAFCQWGVPEHTARNYSRDYLVRELEAYRSMDADGAMLVDAGLNLNQHAFHSLAAAEAEVHFFRDHWLSCEIYPTHLREEHCVFLDNARVHHVGIGLQTYDESVLRHLARPFDAERFERNVLRVAEVAPVGIEIIFGLPFDSPASFWRTLERALSLSVSVVVFHCLVLPDALMTRAPEGADIKFNPHTLEMISCAGWSERDLQETRARLHRLADDVGGESGGSYWEISPAGVHRPTGVELALSREQETSIAECIGATTSNRWRLATVSRQGAELLARIATPEGDILLEIREATVGMPSYRVLHGMAFSYLVPDGRTVQPDLSILDRAIAGLGGPARQALGLPPSADQK